MDSQSRQLDCLDSALPHRVERWKEDATVALFDREFFVRGSPRVESFPVSFSILSFCNEGHPSLNGSCVLSSSLSLSSFPIHFPLPSEWPNHTGKHLMHSVLRKTVKQSFILSSLLFHNPESWLACYVTTCRREEKQPWPDVITPLSHSKHTISRKQSKGCLC